jgi:hypothetical protein
MTCKCEFDCIDHCDSSASYCNINHPSWLMDSLQIILTEFERALTKVVEKTLKIPFPTIRRLNFFSARHQPWLAPRGSHPLKIYKFPTPLLYLLHHLSPYPPPTSFCAFMQANICAYASNGCDDYKI